MTRSKAKRARLTGLLAPALGALALLAVPGMAAAKDRNHDRIPDRWERHHRLSLKVNQAHRDQDRDHLDNRDEFMAGDNPRDNDSDADGIADGEENAGTISSFDPETGGLVLSLFGGEALSGTVTEGTRIRCEMEHSTGATVSSGGQGESGDDHGDGTEPGDDNGGQGEEEPGDDDHGGGDNSGPGNSGEGNSGAGSQNSGPGPDEGGQAECSTSNLTAGAVVREAELEVEHGVATFEEVELAG
jgi:hypothetical protein